MLDKCGVLAPNLFPYSGPKSVDKAVFPYWIEDLVRLSVLKVVIEKDTYFHDFSASLSDFHRHTIVVVDPIKKHRLMYSILEPIFREYKFTKLYESGDYSFEGDWLNQKATCQALSYVHDAIGKLVGATIYQTSISIELEACIAALDYLYKNNTDKDAKAILSNLYGTFSSYKETDIPGVKFVSKLSNEKFGLLLNDAEYKYMSHEASKLGRLTADFKSTILNMKNYSKTLTKKGPFKALVNTTSAASKIGGVPLPDSKYFEELASEQYLPPIIELEESFKRAYRTSNVFGS
jgi:hypothetical protein